jgi:hypothetical protein
MQCFNEAENEGKGEKEIEYKMAYMFKGKEPAYEKQHAYYAANNGDPDDKNVSFRWGLYFNNTLISTPHFTVFLKKHTPLLNNFSSVQAT